jgi:tetratricopeptide (TPR) repeat protein
MKKHLILAGLLMLSGCDSPEESLAKAKAEFANHDYAAARVRIASALEEQPNNRELLLLQARNFVALGDGEGARSALDRLLGGKPASGELAELAAEAALLRKATNVALDLLGQSTTPEAERLRAIAALQKGDAEKARAQFEKALAAGGNARAFADYARLKLMGGDIAGAKELSARAAKAAPDGIDTLLVEAIVALRHGDLKASLGKYERATQLYPTSLAALTGKAAVLGDLGRTKEMDATVKKALELAPRDLTALYLKTKSAHVRKDWEAVRATVRPIEAQLDPLDPMRQLYAEALLKLNQAELAAAQLQPIVRAAPANREARRLLGEAQLANGDAKTALATLKVLAEHPAARPDELASAAKAAKAAGDAALANVYGSRAMLPAAQALGRDLADADLAMRVGNWAGAVVSYKRVMAMTDGRDILVLNNMAYAQSMLGNHDEALDLSNRAMQAAPNNPSVLDTAGWALFRSGKNPIEARRLLRKAAQLAPQNATIRAHLAEAERAPG